MAGCDDGKRWNLLELSCACVERKSEKNEPNAAEKAGAQPERRTRRGLFVLLCAAPKSILYSHMAIGTNNVQLISGHDRCLVTISYGFWFWA